MNQILEVDSYRFHYWAAGDARHSPLVFFHGFMGNCYDFEPAIVALSQTAYCVAVDLPGHGATQVTGRESCYTMAETAQGLMQFLQALELTPCRLIGYSMGGRLALYLALHFPAYFSQVILESASPGLKTSAEQAQRTQEDFKVATALETQDFSQFLTQWYNQPLWAAMQQHPDFPRMLQRRLQGDPRQLAQALRYLGLGSQPSLWEKLPSNLVPLRLLVGGQDQKFIAINTEMARLCSVAQMEIIGHCGHNIHLEDGKAFLGAILAGITG